MYRNPNDFSEYGSVSQETDYADPTYYQQESRSAQPVQPLDPYTGYAPSVQETGYYEYGNVVPAKPETSPTDRPHIQQEYQSPPIEHKNYVADGDGVEQHEDSAESTDGPKKRKGLAGLGGLAVTIGGLLLKLKGLIFFIKFAPALISAAVSVVVYSLFFGWSFALGIVASLFIHEMGHALVMKLKGIPVGGLIFIPLLGAAVTMRQMPANAKDEAEVGIAGPIAGAIAASVCLVLAELTPNTRTIWAPLAYFGFFINLFNLVPIVPFDGGRVLAAIDRRIWILGFAGLLIYQIWLWMNGNFSIFLLFFIIIAATQLWSRGNVNTPESKAYYDVPLGTRITLGLVYFGLAVVLVLGMTISHGLMPIV